MISKNRISILIIFALMFFSFKIEEIDIYSVIRVNGAISHHHNGKSLFTGDKVKSNEKLDFKTSQSKAAVISKLKGRFILASAQGKENFSLMPAMNNISSRAGAIINQVDLQNHFSNKYLVLDNHKIEINERNYPMNDTNFFFLKFNYNGEIISKKILFSENKLSFNKKAICTVDGHKIELDETLEMTLYYRNSIENTSTRISTFQPVFANSILLIDEIKIILTEYSDLEESKKIDEVLAYLTENYGSIQRENLEEWMKTNFSN